MERCMTYFDAPATSFDGHALPAHVSARLGQPPGDSCSRCVRLLIICLVLTGLIRRSLNELAGRVH